MGEAAGSNFTATQERSGTQKLALESLGFQAKSMGGKAGEAKEISWAQPCQGWGRGFESPRPLQFFQNAINCFRQSCCHGGDWCGAELARNPFHRRSGASRDRRAA